MAQSLNVLNVFLGSPGDLVEERVLVKSAVDELNSELAQKIGFQINLIGWEDTTPGYGRPQERINQDLARCEVFMGLMWQWWGSPTGNDFTSGFHEEYTISCARREIEGAPDICLFFKDIDKGRLLDPGAALKRVLEFKESVIKARNVLFKEFVNHDDLKKLVRRYLIDYMLSHNSLMREDDELDKSGTVEREYFQPEENTSDLVGNAVEFLREIANKIAISSNMASLDKVSSARLRLISSAAKSFGNDEGRLGIHDSNIIYRNRMSLNLSAQEVHASCESALAHVSEELAPLWHWISERDKNSRDHLQLEAAFSADRFSKRGALQALMILRRSFVAAEISSSNLASAGLAPEVDESDRQLLLQYLQVVGSNEHMPAIVAEYDKKSSTETAAVQAILSILNRTDPDEACRFSLVNAFDGIEEDIVLRSMTAIRNAKEADVRFGLSHRNRTVRFSSLREAERRSILSIDDWKRFLGDESALIRVHAYRKVIGQPSLDALRDVYEFYARGKVPGEPRWIEGKIDADGLQLYYNLKIALLKGLSSDELAKFVDKGGYDSWEALTVQLFRRSEIDMPEVVSRIRAGLSAEKLAMLATRFPEIKSTDNEFIGKTGIYDDLPKRMMELLMRLVANSNDKSLLALVRAVGGTSEIAAVVEAAPFLQKFGTTEDVEMLVEAVKKRRSGTFYISAEMRKILESVAAAALAIAKRDNVDPLTITDSQEILPRIIRATPLQRFRELSEGEAVVWLKHKDDAVRKAIALRIVETRTKRFCNIVMADVFKERTYFYNSVFFLDLGVSLARDEARRAAKSMLSSL